MITARMTRGVPAPTPGGGKSIPSNASWTASQGIFAGCKIAENRFKALCPVCGGAVMHATSGDTSKTYCTRRCKEEARARRRRQATTITRPPRIVLAAKEPEVRHCHSCGTGPRVSGRQGGQGARAISAPAGTRWEGASRGTADTYLLSLQRPVQALSQRSRKIVLHLAMLQPLRRPSREGQSRCRIYSRQLVLSGMWSQDAEKTARHER